ncbi:terpene cyclase/mutase family protein [Patescibacteria group bacterium]|nr:terpene cyclase/mutase family protein [Patescibacteria group bacterium]
MRTHFKNTDYTELKRLHGIFLVSLILIGSFVFFLNVKAEEISEPSSESIEEVVALVEQPVEKSAQEETMPKPTSPKVITQALTIRYEDNIVFDGSLEIANQIEFEYTKNKGYVDVGVFSTTSTEKTVLNLVLQAITGVENLDVSSDQLIYYADWSPPSYYLKCITIDSEARCDNWQYTVNGQYPSVGMDTYEIDDTLNNQIYLYFGDRYQITTDKDDYFQDENLVGTIYEYNYQDGIYVTSTDSNQVLAITKTAEDWSDTVLSSQNIDENGQVNLTVPSEIGDYNLGLENGNYYWPKKSFSVSEYFSTNLMIRYQDQIILNQGVHLPTSSTYIYHNQGEEKILTTTTDKITVLGLLSSLDETEINFDLSDVEYYESAWGNGFYVKCINVVLKDESTKNACQNWQYVVDGSYPWVGMDQYELSEKGQNIYLYFGDRYQITTDKNEYEPLEQITSNLFEFDYLNGIYASSTSALDQLDLYQANPDWTNTVFASSTVGENSQILFTAPETEGNYNIGLNAGGYYWPYLSIDVKPNKDGTEEDGNTGGTGSGSYTPPPDTFINDAFSFLNLKIENGNFFDNPMYTDWAAIAYASNSGNSSQKASIIEYLLANPVIGDIITDYERRAMALMALEKNPYNSTTDVNYIQKIVDSFDGTQIGDNNLFNDDIFGLITLLNAGYTYEDEEISKSTDFIISKQNNIDGGFGGTDLTAATIQALTIINSNNEIIISAIDSAKNYLKTMQTDTGGFKSNTNDTKESVFSTSWSLQAIFALGENENDWKKNNNKPSDYLQSQQEPDGGLLFEEESEQSRAWATSYVIPAYLNKTWDNILYNFEKPNTEQSYQNPSLNTTPNTTEITTSTPTSTLDINLDIETTTSTPTTTLEILEEKTSTSTIEVLSEIILDEEEVQIPLPVIQANPNYNPPDTNSLAQNNTMIEKSPKTHNLKPGTGYSEVKLINPGTETLSVNNSSTIPYSKTAKGVFAGATSMAGALGIFLAWRFLQTLI